MPSTPKFAAVTVLVTLAAACGSGSDDAASDAANTGDDAASESTTTTLSAEDQARAEVVDAREAAWVAKVESLNKPRELDPELPETLSSRELLKTVDHVMAASYTDVDGTPMMTPYTVYDDWNVNVESVVFLEDDTAILETCLDYYLADMNVRTDEPISTATTKPGYHTAQATEIMEPTDDGWKLALTLPNYHEATDDNTGQGYGECPVEATEERLADEAVVTLREDAEAQYVDALTSLSPDDLTMYSGQVSVALTGQDDRAALRDYCPLLPALWSDEEDQLPDYYDDTWHTVYETSWRERETRNSTDEGNVFAEPDQAYLECEEPFTAAHFHFFDKDQYPANAGNHDGSTSQVATVDNIVWSEDLAVAYFSTCRDIDFINHRNPEMSRKGSVRAIESLRHEDQWVLTNRWDIEHSDQPC